MFIARISTRLLVALPLAAAVAFLPMTQAQQAPAPASTAAKAPESRPFSQQDLDELLAPIALYPDALLAQVFMASTYPLEVVQAARWSKANPSVTGKALEDAMQTQAWDPAVKSLTALPQVLTMMNEKLDWTTKLGDAVLAQQADVMKTVQMLRKKANDAGNLKSSPEQTVRTEVQNSQTVVIIEPKEPEKIYVPTYDPAVVYGPWWYPYPPPYYYYPPGYGYGYGYYGAGAFAFTAGVIVGAAIWGGCGWGNNEININSNRYNNFNRTNISDGKFNHASQHRKGASYRDKATAQKYNRGGDARASQSREQFRGRAESGRSQLQGMDRGQLQSQVSAADRGGRGGGDAGSRGGDLGSRGGGASASQRGGDFGSRGSTASTSDRGGGFSGTSNGAGTRAASTRGSSSRGGGGGGGRGGGGGGRR